MYKCKTLVVIATVTALLSASAPLSDATMPVIDYASITQSIQAQFANISQYVQTVSNTLRTYQTTVQQLQQFYTYLTMFGDPSKVAGMLGLGQEYQMLNQLRNAKTIQDTMGALNGASSYGYTANGVWQPLTQVDQYGQTIQRTAQQYNPYNLVEKTFDNYRQASQNLQSAQNALSSEYQTTLGQIQNATSDAEVQKLAQKANAIKALMDANQNQLNNALGQVQATSEMVQVENQKQALAAMAQHMQERNSTSNTNAQTGTFGLYGNGPLPNGPAWLGQ
jgi:uncharacterized protein YjgD (DUF1641 family)